MPPVLSATKGPVYTERDGRSGICGLPSLFSRSPCALIDWLPRDRYARFPTHTSGSARASDVYASETHSRHETEGGLSRVCTHIWQFPAIAFQSRVSSRYSISGSDTGIWSQRDFICSSGATVTESARNNADISDRHPFTSHRVL